MTAGPVRPAAGGRVGVAVPAAGLGRRMGGVRKPFLLLEGEPVLVHALRPFLAEPTVVAVVVALVAEDAACPQGWLTGLDERIGVVAGGAARSESVRAALAALPDDLDVIAVHDAARPLLQGDVLRRCIDLALTGVGAVAGHPAVDTMKQVDADARIVATPPRAELWNAQTPQVFPAALLRRAYEEEDRIGTDDASLVEALGAEVRMVDAGALNLKVTRPEDLVLAEAVLRQRRGEAR
jgi:2-C-methyl-D-erythritol 4-phosphate cytidylyltransferase